MTQVPPETIQELRNSFFNKIQQENAVPTELFHPVDIDKINNTDAWLQRFLLHHELDVKEALNMLWNTCEWRKLNKVNEINEQNVNLDYLKEGSFFPYNCDKDEKILLVFKCKMHVKGDKDFEELKKCLIYWFERLERETNGDQITIFFDMTDAGVNNLDMEYTKYLIALNKYYYPNFLNYILIFEMSWILNATFRIIKTWLPARAVQKIKFLDKNSLKEYVEPKCALLSWGGEDNFEFVFTPEIRIDAAKNDDIKKKVHFSENKTTSAENSPAISSFRDMKSEDPSFHSDLLVEVKQPDIHFKQVGSEYTGVINIENISHGTVVYKIKTTSPERYRVRPSSGMLQEGSSTKISVVLQSGYQASTICKDRFLIMCLQSVKEHVTIQDIVEMWKQPDAGKIEQHKLRCSLTDNENSKETNGGVPTSSNSDDLMDKMEQLKNIVYQMCECNGQLHKDMLFRQNILTGILIFLILCILALFYIVIKNSSANISQCNSCPSSVLSSALNNNN